MDNWFFYLNFLEEFILKIFDGVERVLVFGAHGDDEIIGCGATIACLTDRGVKVKVVTFTKRETSFVRAEDQAGASENAMKEMKAANDILGVERQVLGLQNRGVVNSVENFNLVTQIVREFRPDIIFTHSHRVGGTGELHRDHMNVAALVDEARWKASENLYVQGLNPWATGAVLYYEIYNMMPNPTLIVTFGEKYLQRKLEAMRTQVSQLEVLQGIEQQIQGLAMVRGAMIGGKGCFGEAFEISSFFPTRIDLA